MSEIPNDEDNDHLFQDEIDVSNFVEKTFFRKSAYVLEFGLQKFSAKVFRPIKK